MASSLDYKHRLCCVALLSAVAGCDASVLASDPVNTPSAKDYVLWRCDLMGDPIQSQASSKESDEYSEETQTAFLQELLRTGHLTKVSFETGKVLEDRPVQLKPEMSVEKGVRWRRQSWPWPLFQKYPSNADLLRWFPHEPAWTTQTYVGILDISTDGNYLMTYIHWPMESGGLTRYEFWDRKNNRRVAELRELASLPIADFSGFVHGGDVIGYLIHRRGLDDEAAHLSKVKSDGTTVKMLFTKASLVSASPDGLKVVRVWADPWARKARIDAHSADFSKKLWRKVAKTMEDSGDLPWLMLWSTDSRLVCLLEDESARVFDAETGNLLCVVNGSFAGQGYGLAAVIVRRDEHFDPYDFFGLSPRSTATSRASQGKGG